MRGSTARRLLDLNQEFYRAFAGPFAVTRNRLQPGILTALAELDLSGPLLDVGCGEGRLGRHLAAMGFAAAYLGVDHCAPLLERARAAGGPLEFLELDLARPGWEETVRRIQPTFASATCFSVLHHLPGPGRRLRLLKSVASLLVPGGSLALSVWQPLCSERLRSRLLAWERAGVDPAELEPGDLLMPWGHGAPGARYVHHFEEGELLRLLERAGWEPRRLFRSDGREGLLGLYVLARRPGGQTGPGDSRAPHPAFTDRG